MDRLYDASAFFNILSKTTQHDHFVGQALLDLTKYELGNAVSKKQTKDNKDAMLQLFNRCMQVTENMHVIDMRGLEHHMAVMAASTKLTFYDSAYVVVAERGGLVLVTDDAEMSDVARRRGIPTISSAEV